MTNSPSIYTVLGCTGLLEEAGIRNVPVSLEMIGGGGKTAIIRKLIGFLERRGLLDYLVQTVRNARPGRI